MSDLDKLIELKRFLGDDCFNVLLNSDYWEAAKQFYEGIILETVAKKITVGGRVYAVVNPFEPGERKMSGTQLISHAQRLDAHLSEDEGEHVWENNHAIPDVFRGRIILAFTNWLYRSHPATGHIIEWNDKQGEFVKSEVYFQHGEFKNSFRLLRRL